MSLRGLLHGNQCEDFVSALMPDENSNEVWERPVAPTSLRIADGGAGKLSRISYGK
ncbi:MAG: hypothetical protein ABI646_10190 [Acidobacteriota bacterium]